MNLTLEQYEKLNPRCEIEHRGVRMVFATPTIFTKWRVETIYSKEPCTLEWIATFESDDILLDVGANVGMYSIWAAATRAAQVFALEPEAQNFALLNRNIMANGLHQRIKAYCVGLSDRQEITALHIADLRVGGSNHSVGEAVNFELEPLQAAFEQGCVCYRLDDLLASNSIPLPKHIKIDVDGLEHKVIAGARATLANPGVKSLLIETNLNLERHRAMVAELNQLGFRHDPAQVEKAMRKDGPFKGVAEHIFRR